MGIVSSLPSGHGMNLNSYLHLLQKFVNTSTEGLAVERTGGDTRYTPGTNSQLTLVPASGFTAVWAIQDGESGINAGGVFIPVPGVTVQ